MEDIQLWILHLLLLMRIVTGIPTWVLWSESECPKEGGGVTLLCALNGLESQAPKWNYFVNGTPILVSSGTLVFSSECSNCEITGDQSIGEYHMRIESVTANNAGLWACSQFGADPPSRNVQLLIKKPCEGVTLTVADMPISGDKNLVVVDGATLNVTCELYGCDASCANITWLNGTDRLDISKSQLSYTVSRFDNSRTINCSISNELTTAIVRDYIELDVRYKPVDGRITYKCIGQNVEATCYFDANPTTYINYTWEYIGNGERHGNVIVISSFLSGVVKCWASNEYGQSDHPAELEIKECSENCPPWCLSLSAILCVIAVGGGVALLIYCCCREWFTGKCTYFTKHV